MITEWTYEREKKNTIFILDLNFFFALNKQKIDNKYLIKIVVFLLLV